MDSSEHEEKFSTMMPPKLDIENQNLSQFRHWEQKWKDFVIHSGLDQQVR